MRVIFLLILINLLSCKDDKIKFNFPADIETECHNYLAHSRNCIMDKGYTVNIKHGLTVKKHVGEKYYGPGQGWGWFSPGHNFWVLGLYYSTSAVIEVGAHPVTLDQVEVNVLNHEFGHYWLYSNAIAMGHPPEFASCFMNWRDGTDNHFYNLNSEENKVAFDEIYRQLDHGEVVSVIIDQVLFLVIRGPIE